MIEKIDGPTGVRTAMPVRRPAKTGDSSRASFAHHLDEGGEAAATSSLGGTQALTSIWGLQEVEDATARAARGKARAEDILDRLDDVRMDILSGALSPDKLMQLSRIVSARRAEISDPRLAELLDEIDLRAQVELAKYTV